MARSRFVRPDTTTLTLTNGDTLVVKCRLNYGEARKLRGMQDLPTLKQLAVVVSYLLDWSLKDDSGQRVSIADLSPTEMVNRLDALEDDSFDEIFDAIAAHIDRMQAERDQEKNARDGATESSAISPSPSAAAGELIGSVN